MKKLFNSNSKKSKLLVGGLGVILGISAVGGTAFAAGTFKSFTPKSYGTFIYDDGDSTNNNGKDHDLVLDSSDITNLNDNLNVLKSDVDSCFQSVSNGKALLASTLTGLGITTASDATFATINTNITTLANNKYNSGYSAGAASVDTSGTATEADIVKDKTAVVNGRRLTGTLDTQTYYNNGYTAGAASVDTQSYYNNGYADGQNASRCMVTIPGQQWSSSSASTGNKTVTLTVSSLSGFTHMDQPVTRGTSGTTEAAIQVNKIVIKDASGNTIKTESCVNGGKRSNNIIAVTDRGVIDITGAASIEITVTRRHAGSYGNACGIDISSFNLYNYEVQPTTRPSIPEVWIS